MIAEAEPHAVLIIITRSVLNTLSSEELEQTIRVLREKSKIEDPDNPNLWIHKTPKYEVWAILNEHAGPNGEDVLTILFPSDY